MSLPDCFFRTLTLKEEQAFRDWAIANHVAGKPAEEYWHPIVREEWARLEALETKTSEK